jgi:hypothetical protein
LAALYSTLFAAVNVTAVTNDPVYTVPPGFVAVLRDVDVVSIGSSGNLLFIAEQTSGLSFIAFNEAAADVSVQWQGRQVFPAGQVMYVRAVTGQWLVRMSGYLLSMP